MNDVRLRGSTCAISSGTPAKLDLNCQHLLQEMQPLVGNDKRLSILVSPNLCLPDEEYHGESFENLLERLRTTPLKRRVMSLVPRRRPRQTDNETHAGTMASASEPEPNVGSTAAGPWTSYSNAASSSDGRTGTLLQPVAY